MAEFLSPDVRIEERTSDSHRIERISSGIAGFLGVAQRGPVGVPQFITSFAQYRRVFGGFIAESHLPYAVDGFFKRHEGRCFVVRTAHYTDPADTGTLTALAATVTLDDRAGTPAPTLKVNALNEGAWGNDLSVRVADAIREPAQRFRLLVIYKGAVVETFEDLTLLETDQDYALSSVNNRSEYIRLENLASATAAPDNRPGLGTFSLTGGDDGLTGLTDNDYLGDAGARTGLRAFDSVEEIGLLAIPGVTSLAVHQGLLTYAEDRQDIFVLLDSPQGLDVVGIKQYVEEDAAFNSKYGALYYPNLVIRDPLTGKPRLTPPSGQLARIYAITDDLKGVHKAPAGIDDGRFLDVIGLERQLNKAERDLLYPARINTIIKKRGIGVVAWGNRTLSAQSDWRSINVRRLFLQIVRSIAEGTEWAVFQPNNDALWRDLTTTLTLFLKDYWREGAFFDGGSGNWRDAFYVKCDGDLNTQSVIDQHRVVTDIGIAPTKAAEFVVIRLSQWDGGRLVEELGLGEAA